MLSSTPAKPPTRLTVALIALTSIVFHLWLASKLGGIRSTLFAVVGLDEGPAGQADDARDLEGAEYKRLAGVGALLGIARLWALCSAGIATAGVYGLVKDRLPFLRLYVLNSFLSLSLDILLLSLTFLLLTLSPSSSSSSSNNGLSLATTLCQAISSSPSASTSLSLSIGLPDLLGLSLETCEDRFDGLLFSALSTLAVVEALRGWAALRVLAYYSGMAVRRGGRSGRRPDDLSLLPERREGAGGGGERYHDSPVELDSAGTLHNKSKRRNSFRRDRSNSRSMHLVGGSGGGGGGSLNETRILVLPRAEDASRSGGGGNVPALTLTASSPVRTSFPPNAQSPRKTSAGGGGGKGKVLVYAPVYMDAEEARTCGATELVLQDKRSRSSHSSSSSSATITAGARSRSSTIVPSSYSNYTDTVSSAPSSGLTVDTTKAAQHPSQTGSTLVRQDSDEAATPVAVRAPTLPYGDAPQQAGLLEVLRGDLEAEGVAGGADKGKLA